MEEKCMQWIGGVEGQRPLERPRCRCEYNIKEDLKEIECKGLDWSNMSGDRDNWTAVLNMAVYVALPRNAFVRMWKCGDTDITSILPLSTVMVTGR